MINLNHHQQKTDYDCGSTVLRIVCDYYEIPTKSIKSDAIYGIHPFELEPAFRRLGLKVTSGEMDVEDLKYHTSKGRPVICLVQCEGMGHWVVCYNVSRGFVRLCDPAEDKKTKFAINNFNDIWHDNDRNGTIFRGYGLVVFK
jgi:ABC-type bacteriocin/lantibiotic exporter with double-glycine peptidase domain